MLRRTQKAFRQAGGHWSTFLIWAKNTFTLGRSGHWVAVSPDPRPGTGSPLRMFYRGSAGDGEVAYRQRRAERGHAIDRRVLDAGVRSAGAAWFESVSGECPAHEEPAGAQKRCAGVSMAAEIARLWTAE